LIFVICYRHTALDAASPDTSTVLKGIAEQARNDGRLFCINNQNKKKPLLFFFAKEI